MDIRQLQPQSLWQHFDELNAIPRASKKETAVCQFMVDFGRRLNLETFQDETGNVIIRKPATKGMEERQTLLLQSHLDMVHQKNADVDFDFATQGIQMFVEEDWVKAKGTTLGADNGIGVAAIMAVLQSTDLPHPALEALFTVDEETGMTGALGLKPGVLSAKIMLNLDTEEDNELTIGCAGGVDVTGTGSYESTVPEATCTGYTLAVSGLKGGHSGTDIILGRANANKLMNRLLFQAYTQFELCVAEVDGGGLRNAIPRESTAIICVPEARTEEFEKWIAEETETLRQEYGVTDSELTISLKPSGKPEKVISKEFQGKILRVLYTVPNGIYRMSPNVAGMVQTSNNLARVLVKDGSFMVQCLTRSSVDSEKMDLARGIQSALELAGAAVTFTGQYPGWTPQPDAKIASLMSDKYEELFGEKAHVAAVHAGLECGIIGGKYPGMEMISFGPNITGAHSPDEQVQVSSVQKFWKFLTSVLENAPRK